MKRYSIIEKQICSDNEKSITYGIAVNSNGITKRVIHDISVDRESLENLVRLCNSEQLCEIHLDEVIENFLLDGKNP